MFFKPDIDKMNIQTNRRNFIRQCSSAAAGLIAVPIIIPSCARGKDGHVAPSDRITIGFIGAGNQAGNDARDFLKDERVQIVAVCDVNRESTGYWNGATGGREPLVRMINQNYSEKTGKKFSGCLEFEDFRELIARNDIDAVEVVTPDHWHAIPVLMAAAAGKDIYCQKPLALTVPEGRAISNSVKKHKVVFQTGSQQRSAMEFRRACELVRNGRIGKLHTVRCGLPSGTPDYGKTGHLTGTVKVPGGFNYDMWLGPAPDAPYCPARTHVNFRWVLDYSGGQLTDWGGHHPDIAHWGMDTEYTGPVRIVNPKATWANHPIWNTATEYYFEAIYENGLKMIVSNKERGGVTFEGSDGWVWANRGKHEASSEEIMNSVISNDEIHLYQSENHFRNFIDCVISRKEPIAPAEIAHRSITVAHLGNIAMKLEQDLEWDPVTEKFVHNDTANQMLHRQMRAPWDKVYREHLV